MAPLKPGITRLLTVVHPPEEVVIGTLEAQDHLLQHMRSQLLIFWSKLFDVYQFAFLLVVANGMLTGQLLTRFVIVVVGMTPDA